MLYTEELRADAESKMLMSTMTMETIGKNLLHLPFSTGGAGVPDCIGYAAGCAGGP